MAFALGLVLFGQRVHWVEEAGTAERDGFVGQAETLLEGQLPHDPYRPLLYPLLVALLSKLVGDPFTAARLVSNAAAVGLAALGWLFARRLGGRWAGLWALLLLVVNPNLWILGQHASTDALFAFLGGVVWWSALCYLDGDREPRTVALERRAVLAGATALALAFFTRTSAVFLLPGCLLAWWWSAARRQGRGYRHLAMAGALVGLLLLPHFVLRARQFGSPFHDENFKNLAFKLYGFPDWSYLERVPFRGLGDVMLHDPGAVLVGFGSELVRFARSGLAQLLGTQLHVVLLVVGAWALWRRIPRRVLLLVGCASSFVAGVALVFFAWGRLVLVVLPPLAALLAAGWVEAQLWDRLRPARRTVGLGTLVLGLAVGLLATKTFFFRLPAFVERHPYAEVEVLRRWDRELGNGAVLAGTSPFLGRYIHHRYLALPDAFGDQVESEQRYYASLGALLARQGVDLLVVGKLDLRDRPESLLGAAAPVDWLVPRGCQERDEPHRVCVWQVDRRRLGGGSPERGEQASPSLGSGGSGAPGEVDEVGEVAPPAARAAADSPPAPSLVDAARRVPLRPAAAR